MTRRQRQDLLAYAAEWFERGALDAEGAARQLIDELKRHRAGDGLPYSQIDSAAHALFEAIKDLRAALSDALSTGNQATSNWQL